MTKYVLIFLMCVSLSYGAHSWVIGGAGTGADKHTQNGGGYLTGGTATWNTFQATNGGPTDTITVEAVNITDNGTSDVRITDFAAAGSMTSNMVVGQLQNIDFSNTVNYTSGRYIITAIINTDSWDIDISYIADDLNKDITVFSGGALPNPGDVPDSDDIAVGNVLVAGAKIWIRALADYTTVDESDSILFINQAGTVSAPIIWEGHFAEISSEKGDFGIATFNASGKTNAIETNNAGGIHHVFIGISCENATDDGANLGTLTDDSVTFIRCQFINNGVWGVQGDNNLTAIFCDFDNNSGGGFDGDNELVAINCVFRNNTGNGITSRIGHIIDCLIFDSTNAGITIQVSPSLIYGCTIDGNDGAGTEGILKLSQADMWVGINNILTDCVIGIADFGDMRQAAILYNNLYNSNTDDTSNVSPVPSDSDIWSNIVDPANLFDPAYILHADNKGKGVDASYTKAYWDDFNGGAGDNPLDPLTGLSFMDMGGLQREEAGGSGGGQPVIGGSVVR